jgi:hypothetical protein
LLKTAVVRIVGSIKVAKETIAPKVVELSFGDWPCRMETEDIQFVAV